MDRNVRAGMAMIAILGVLACDEQLPTAPPSPQLPAPVSSLVELRGEVDLVAGTLTFISPGPRGTAGALLAIYGGQGTMVRLYNTPVARTDVGTKRLFTGAVGIQNLRSHPIGDEQAGPSPAEIMGIYVFFNNGPTVTSTSSSCPACTVTVKNNHGTLAFNAPTQKYFHWPERVAAGDTTALRTTWTFEADTAVTNFSFEVLVSAAWTPPNETSWGIEYSGDSLPHLQAEPRWRRMLVGTGPSDSAATGFLRIQMGAPTNTVDLYYQRRDSLITTTNAFAEARLKLVSGTGDAHTGFGFDDNVKQIEIGMSTTEVGFIDDGYGFIDKIAIAPNVYRTYQIRKFAADSVQLWIDGTRRLTVPYTSLKPNAAAATIPSYFRFGSHGKGGVSNVSDWDNVSYLIGRSSP